MKALTLTQPWAGLVASGIKRIENRPWKPSAKMIGERFAIHASRAIDRDAWRGIIEIAPEVALDYPGPMAPACRVHRLAEITSAIIGVATVVTWVTHPHQIDAYTSPEQTKWFFGPVGFVLTDIHTIAAPVPCKGALGFWQVPDDVARQVEEQLL
ncbi:MAG: ASCH domain-containing protein [Kofleriaceae bacterium]